MPVITTIRPTTEVQAVSIMLESIGEQPLPANSNLSTLSASDTNVAMAVEILGEITREVLTNGWRFNTLTGLELRPTTTYSWPASDATTTLLNVYKKPADWLHWKMTPCRQMQDIELIERLSLKYTETGNAVLVFFDRIRNRDGVEAASFPFLYFDVVFSVDFENMPECARYFAAIAAAREMCTRVPSSEQQAGFIEKKLTPALRVLKREQGLPKNLNFFATADAYEMNGRRWARGGGFSTTVYPGGN